MPAQQGDEVLAVLRTVIQPELLAPAVGAQVVEDELARAFGVSAAPEAPWSRIDGHLFVLLEGSAAVSEPDRVAGGPPTPRPGETAFVLARGGEGEPWVFLGVGRRLEEEQSWRIPELEFATWRRFGRRRAVSRRLPTAWREAAKELVEDLLETFGAGTVVSVDERTFRLVGAAPRGGLRIDGGDDGFAERTVSLADVGWVLLSKQRSAQAGAVLNESYVNRQRYLVGTPKKATRWIDTGWALRIVRLAESNRSTA